MGQYSTTTAMYFPPIYKNGVNINPDRNITTTVCRCLNCNGIFSYRTRGGELIDDDYCGNSQYFYDDIANFGSHFTASACGNLYSS